MLTTAGSARRSLVTGGQGGYIHMWDLENPQRALWEVKGHTGIVNAIDGCGGQAKGYGAPEIVTCGQDGAGRSRPCCSLPISPHAARWIELLSRAKFHDEPPP